MTCVILMGSIFAGNAQDVITKIATGKKGVASYYHSKFDGRKTATGETFRSTNYTAASNNLKLGTFIKVTNLRNSSVVYVKVNDRMAPSNKRVVDLTASAAEALHFKAEGLTQVSVEVVTEAEGRRAILAQREGDGIVRNTL